MKEKTSKGQIVQVHFFEPINGKTDYYFGSIKAIYAEFTKEQIGVSLESLYTYRVSQDRAKITKKCRIIKHPISRVAQQ